MNLPFNTKAGDPSSTRSTLPTFVNKALFLAQTPEKGNNAKMNARYILIGPIVPKIDSFVQDAIKDKNLGCEDGWEIKFFYY